MSNTRIPGPGGYDANVCTIDAGTMVRSDSALPGVVGHDDVAVRLPLEERFEEVLRRTLPLLPGELQDEFGMLLSPASLAVMAGTLTVWAGSHYFGVGFVVDAILVAGGILFLGLEVVSAASDLIKAIDLTFNARTDGDLDQASAHLANFIAVVGVAAFMALLFKGGNKGRKNAATTSRAAGIGAASNYGGMVPAHWWVFRDAAVKHGRIIGVRNTNRLSTQWIAKGYPPKPLEIKIKTSKTTGIVTAENTADISKARELGYIVIDEHGIPRDHLQRPVALKRDPEWPVEPGQIIDPKQLKPLVGDYDLLTVVDPSATGGNLALAFSDGIWLEDRFNPDVKRIAKWTNSQLDQPRVMHGAHDQWADAKAALIETDGATIFYPDGSVKVLETGQDAVDFFSLMKRRTHNPAANPPAPVGKRGWKPVVIEGGKK